MKTKKRDKSLFYCTLCELAMYLIPVAGWTVKFCRVCDDRIDLNTREGS